MPSSGVIYDELDASSRRQRSAPRLINVYREMRELESEYEGLTPQQQRLVDRAEKTNNTLHKLSFNQRLAVVKRDRAAQAARGSASALLAAGRARRQAQHDWDLGMKTGDRDVTADASRSLAAAKAQYAAHRSRLLNLRNAERVVRTANDRMQRAYPMAQQRFRQVRQALASKPGAVATMARWLLGRR
jgi:hypothetical protein